MKRKKRRVQVEHRGAGMSRELISHGKDEKLILMCELCWFDHFELNMFSLIFWNESDIEARASTEDADSNQKLKSCTQTYCFERSDSMSRRKQIFLDRLVCSDFPEVDLSLVNSWSWWSIPILNIDGLSLNAPWFQKISVRKLCSKLTTLWKAHDYMSISCWSWEITSNGILAPCNSHFHQHCYKITRRLSLLNDLIGWDSTSIPSLHSQKKKNSARKKILALENS
jgi:hypothetical protein